MGQRKVLLKLDLPLSVMVSKKKKFILNMNQYRNLHFRVLAQAKRLYSKIVLKLILAEQTVIQDYPLEVEYKYYHGNNRRHDIMNIISVIDKFTMDSIVDSGIIEDDNTTIIKRYVIEAMGVDKDNPRAEIRIRKI